MKYVEAIENVAKLMDKYDLSNVNYTEGSWSIGLTKSGGIGGSNVFFPAASNSMYAPSESVDTAAASVPAPPESPVSGAEEVNSPMVGVFYNAPSPEADPFVRIGDTVKKGDVLCILEAMKLMNEIQAEHDGKITDICVKNGDVVEFGQTLFKMA